MPWFKVDDKLHDHRKPRQAKKSAMGVWVLSGSWCMDNLTDGFVPESVARRWGTPHDFAALVSAELWESATRNSERGYLFVNWSEFQPTKADVERERAIKAEAGRKGGRASGASRREASAQAGASGLVEPESNPRTRPVPDLEEPSSADADAEMREDVDRLCTRLADRIEANGAKRPSINKGWRTSCRLMLDNDSRTEQQVAWMIDWCQSDEFWRANIMSMPKLREKFDQLKLRAVPSAQPVQALGEDGLPPRPTGVSTWK